ncbi:lysophospholipase D [Schistosoma bovis]|uniref:Lysophospholipase D n=1 Tax=Schistosoma bovis TaxID=6184 RepID=A0A430QD13_SCHBO|nr:lysophospholipase D [Schistosoma bovis]
MLGFIVTVFVAYSFTSYILLRRPIIFLRRKRLPFEASHISHRGGSGEQIENTLEAFSSSLLVGTNMFETDCHITKDNQVVVFHDNTLDRSTGVSGLVKEFSYEDLPRYLRAIEVQFTPDSYHTTLNLHELELVVIMSSSGSFCIAESPSSYKIPRLEDLFNKFPNTPINIDIKVNDNLLINEVSL